MINNLTTGTKGEDLATKYLKQKGFKIIDRNFRIRGGEIDIIAIDKKELVFIEVKTRTNYKFGLPEEAVTQNKQKILIRASKIYKNNHNNLPESERIDVIAIDLENGNYKIRHFKNITL